jgi:molybdenum cofactor cytidylyltransferase
MAMEMAYTKALKLVKQAEVALGYPLITRTTGGKDGGGSVLTPEGRRWLFQYEAYRDACVRSNQALYRQFFPKIGCVIMASGLGKRFGGNKLMAEFQGSPLIQQALDATEGLFASRVVVTRHETVAALCRAQNIEVILHDLPHRSDTVRLGLEALPDLDACMFLPGDQPLLRRQTVAMLVEQWKENTEKIVRPSWEGQEGNPVLFPAWAFPELKNLPEGKGGGVLIKKYPQAVHLVPVADPLELADADTPEALEALKGHCHD